jgi:hypothetical protein
MRLSTQRSVAAPRSEPRFFPREDAALRGAAIERQKNAVSGISSRRLDDVSFPLAVFF